MRYQPRLPDCEVSDVFVIVTATATLLKGKSRNVAERKRPQHQPLWPRSLHNDTGSHYLHNITVSPLYIVTSASGQVWGCSGAVEAS